MPRICAGAFLVRDGLVLLGLRSPRRSAYPGLWDAIGGHAQPGETVRDALVRELSEEICVTPTAFQELAVLAEPQPEIHGEAAHHLFLVTAWSGGDPIVTGHEHAEIRWFSIPDAITLDLAHPGYVQLLQNLDRHAARERVVGFDRVDRFLQDVARWASTRADIQAVALVGSQARGTAAYKSDVDLIVIARTPDMYLEDRSWIRAFGTVVTQQVEDYGKVFSLRVQYTDQLEVEFGLTDNTWAAVPLDPGSREVILGGMRVLFERHPLLSLAKQGAE